MDEKQMLLALMLFFDFVCIAALVYVGWLWFGPNSVVAMCRRERRAAAAIGEQSNG